MSGDFNTSILNRVAFLLFGRQLGSQADEPQPVALSEDRELMIAARITENLSDEEIEVADGVLLIGAIQTVFTNTTSRRLPVCVEVSNSLNLSGATCLVTYSFDGAATQKTWIPSTTQVPLGAPARWGPIHLAPGGTIRASCSPPQSVTLTPVPGAKA